MARRVAPAFPRALLIRGAQSLSLLADQDRRMTLILKVAEAEGYAAAISTVSIAEVRRTGQAANHLHRLRSRLTVIPATGIIADRAAKGATCRSSAHATHTSVTHRDRPPGSGVGSASTASSNDRPSTPICSTSLSAEGFLRRSRRLSRPCGRNDSPSPAGAGGR